MKLLFATHTSLTNLSVSLSAGSVVVAPPSSLSAWGGCLIEITGPTCVVITFSYTANGSAVTGSRNVDPNDTTCYGTYYVTADGHLVQIVF